MKENIAILTSLLLSIVILCGLAAGSQDIIVIQSIQIKPYSEAFKGFKDSCDYTISRRIILSSIENNILDTINKLKPDMVLAIGLDALSTVKEIKEIPIVYLMVPNPQQILSGEENIKGVSMFISAERQLDTFQDILPDIKKIGVLFDPNKTGNFISDAKHAAAECQIGLIAREVFSPKEIPSKINELKKDIEAFWVIPDTTIVTPEMAEYILFISIEDKIPIFTFSEKYVEIGAFVSLNLDVFDMGRQAGEIAEKILSKRQIKNISNSDARKMSLSINLKVAKKLGLNINPEILGKAKIFY